MLRCALRLMRVIGTVRIPRSISRWLLGLVVDSTRVVCFGDESRHGVVHVHRSYQSYTSMLL